MDLFYTEWLVPTIVFIILLLKAVYWLSKAMYYFLKAYCQYKKFDK